tara:strand:- start:2064 stop:3065 length:1002 start_codon:yes stop_codon:yes gene_type:complete
MRAFEIFNEAGLSRTELGKRENLQLFMDMIGKNAPFVKVGDTEPSVVLKPSDELMMQLQKRDIPTKYETVDGEVILLSRLQKTKEFGGTGGSKADTSERQEHGLVNVINANPGTVIEQLGVTVKSARSQGGMNALGKEPYIDIFITDTNGKDHGISMKASSSMTIGGGGTAGVFSMFPKLIQRCYDKVEQYLMDMGLEDQDVVPHGAIPNLFFRIPEKYIAPLMQGNKAMGGPIDWIYVGPSDVTGEVVDGNLNLNGNFYSVDDFVEKTAGDVFFRVRKRDLDGETTEIDFTDVDRKYKLPILMTNQSNKKRNWRLLMTNKGPTNTANILDLD